MGNLILLPNDHVRKHRAFHLHYATGSGGGQWEFAYSFTGNDGMERRSSTLRGRRVSFELRPQGNSSLSVRLGTEWLVNPGHTVHTRLLTDSKNDDCGVLNVSMQMAAALLLPDSSSRGNSTEPLVDGLHWKNYWFDLMPLSMSSFTNDSDSLVVIDINGASVGGKDEKDAICFYEYDLLGRMEELSDFFHRAEDWCEDLNLGPIRDSISYYRRVYDGELDFCYQRGRDHQKKMRDYLRELGCNDPDGDGDILDGFYTYISHAEPEFDSSRVQPPHDGRSGSGCGSVGGTGREMKYFEGERIKMERVVEEQQRSREARKICLELKGTQCAICGFDSSAIYGVPGIIDVHHLDPLSDGGKRETNPERDLIPLCPNCHRAVHSKPGGVYSVDEIKGKMLLMRRDDGRRGATGI